MAYLPVVDEAACSAHGDCEHLAPHVFRVDDFAVVIGTGTREENIAWHREWLLWCPAQLRRLRELRGKVLGCWCHPLPCHGDTLDELANLPEVELEALIRKAEQLRRVHGN